MDRESDYTWDRDSSSFSPSTHKYGTGDVGVSYFVPAHTLPFWQQPSQYPVVYEVPLTWQQLMGVPMTRGDDDWEDGEYRQFIIPIPLPVPWTAPQVPFYPPYSLFPPYPVIRPYPHYPGIRPFPPFFW